MVVQVTAESWFSHLPSSPHSPASTNVPWLCNQVKVAQAPSSSASTNGQRRWLANSHAAIHDVVCLRHHLRHLSNRIDTRSRSTTAARRGTSYLPRDYVVVTNSASPSLLFPGTRTNPVNLLVPHSFDVTTRTHLTVDTKEGKREKKTEEEETLFSSRILYVRFQNCVWQSKIWEIWMKKEMILM